MTPSKLQMREQVDGGRLAAVRCCLRAAPLHIGGMHKFKFMAAALVFSLGLAMGCEDDGSNDSNDDDSGMDNTARIAATCQSYCNKAHTCDDDKTVEQCVADCKADLGDCMVDEQGEALDDLDGCAAESCDDFGACTIGAGLQCTFGI